MRYLVLGAGRQGLAIAYDLARCGEATSITLVEVDEARLRDGAARLRGLHPGTEVREVAAAVSDDDPAAVLAGHDVAVSALPYRFNLALAKAAVAAGVGFCDLGGHTGIVRDELALDEAARGKGVTLVPDCGLAPGLDNVLAAMAVDEVPGARHVRIRCGGLPVDPKGPLEYSLLFDIAGLTNEYTGEAVVLRDGELMRLEAFTECEEFDGFPELGPLEAFLTSGGTSTAPWTYRGRLETYDYKTVRYPGHFAAVRPMIELGLLDLEPVDGIVPREFFHKVAGPRLHDPDVRDVALLLVECTDEAGHGVRYRMLQHFDERTGFTAMEQTTGYPTAVVAHAIGRHALPPGATPPERAGFGAEHLAELRRRGLVIDRETF